MLEEIRQHIGRWVMIALTTIATGSAIGGGWFYFHDEQQRNIRWYADDEVWNRTLIDNQEITHDKLALMISKLDEILSETDELEDDHKRLMETISDSLVDINYRIGQHQGEHE